MKDTFKNVIVYKKYIICIYILIKEIKYIIILLAEYCGSHLNPNDLHHL